MNLPVLGYTKYIFLCQQARYIMYTGDNMNWKKKTEYITFRATEEVKEALRAEAEEHKWSISQLVEQIVSEWLEQKEKT